MKFTLKLQILTVVTLIAIGGGIAETVMAFNAISEAEATSRVAEKEIRGLTEIKASALSTIQLDPASSDTRKVFSDAERNIGNWSAIVRPLFTTPDAMAKLSTIASRWNAYDEKSHRAIDLATYDAKAANHQVTAIYHADFRPFQASLEQFVAETDKEAQSASDAAQDVSDSAVRTVVALMVMALMLMAAWIFALTRSNQRALGQIRYTLQDVSRTVDEGPRAPVQNMDGIGPDATAFNHVMDRVADVMATARESTRSLPLSATQLASRSVSSRIGLAPGAASIRVRQAVARVLTRCCLLYH